MDQGHLCNIAHLASFFDVGAQAVQIPPHALKGGRNDYLNLIGMVKRFRYYTGLLPIQIHGV